MFDLNNQDGFGTLEVLKKLSENEKFDILKNDLNYCGVENNRYKSYRISQI